MIALPVGIDGNAAAGRRELHGIRQQVGQHLPDRRAVRAYPRHAVRQPAASARNLRHQRTAGRWHRLSPKNDMVISAIFSFASTALSI
jgi:hypothetical protein